MVSLASGLPDTTWSLSREPRPPRDARCGHRHHGDACVTGRPHPGGGAVGLWHGVRCSLRVGICWRPAKGLRSCSLSHHSRSLWWTRHTPAVFPRRFHRARRPPGAVRVFGSLPPQPLAVAARGAGALLPSAHRSDPTSTSRRPPGNRAVRLRGRFHGGLLPLSGRAPNLPRVYHQPRGTPLLLHVRPRAPGRLLVAALGLARHSPPRVPPFSALTSVSLPH
jgi:hypothetical protein